MKTLKTPIYIFAAFVLFSGFLTSCLDNENDTPQVYGDALIRSVRQGDSVVYNIQLFAYSWHAMNEVTAYFEDNTEALIELDSIDYKYTYAHLPERTTYADSVPSEGWYYFDVVFDSGEAATVTDYLSDEVIDPVEISELDWDAEAKKITMEWGKITKAQFYKVFLFNEENEVAFETGLIDKSVNELTISKFSQGWHSNKQPTITTLFKVVINAYLFEPVASTFDVQCISVNDQHAVEWAISED